MTRYKLYLVSKEYVDGCKFKDIARLGIAESLGLETIVLDIVSDKLLLSKRILRDILVTNGEQLCFCPDQRLLRNRESEKEWFDTYWSITENGNIICWFNPDGANKYFAVIDEQ